MIEKSQLSPQQRPSNPMSEITSFIRWIGWVAFKPFNIPASQHTVYPPLLHWDSVHPQTTTSACKTDLMLKSCNQLKQVEGTVARSRCMMASFSHPVSQSSLHFNLHTGRVLCSSLLDGTSRERIERWMGFNKNNKW